MISSFQEAEKEVCRPRVFGVRFGSCYDTCARAEDRATLESDLSAPRVVKRLGGACRVYAARFAFFHSLFPAQLVTDKAVNSFVWAGWTAAFAQTLGSKRVTRDQTSICRIGGGSPALRNFEFGPTRRPRNSHNGVSRLPVCTVPKTQGPAGSAKAR
jgi:hypothetical protein